MTINKLRSSHERFHFCYSSPISLQQPKDTCLSLCCGGDPGLGEQTDPAHPNAMMSWQTAPSTWLPFHEGNAA